MHRFHVWHASVLLAGALLTPLPTSAQQYWSMGYWADDSWSPVSSIEWAGVTHISHWTIQPNTDGTIQYRCQSALCSQASFTPFANTLISAAHANGVKVLLSIRPDGDWNSATSPGTLATFVSNLVSAVNTFGYDGIDLDWEISINTTQYINLGTALRTALGSKLLTVASAESAWAPHYTILDRINTQTYDAVTGCPSWTWFNSALNQDDTTHCFPTASIVGKVKILTDLGVPISKINIGLPFYGYIYSGATAPRQSPAGTSFNQINYRNIVANYSAGLISGATIDPVSQSPWFPSGSTYVTFDNAASLTTKINYAKAQNLGGWFIWQLAADDLAAQTPRHPLLHAVALATVGSPPTISSFTATPATIAPGGSSSLAWVETGGTTCSISGIGTVPCSPSSRVVTPAATTTYTLTVTNPAGSVTRTATVTVSPPQTQCNNTSGDAAFIQSAVNTGGTVTINGPCNITSSVNINNSVTVRGGTNPILNGPGQTIFAVRSNNVTINGITFVGGKVYVALFPANNFVFTNNTLRDMTSTNIHDVLHIEGVSNSTITGNTFSNLWWGGYPTAGDPNNPDNWYPVALHVYNGITTTTISNNSFDEIANDAIAFSPPGSSGIAFGQNVSISNNTFTHVHRANVELQTGLNNLVVSGNYIHDEQLPFWNSWGFSLAIDGSHNITVINNTATTNTTSCRGFLPDVFETGGSPYLVQGNVGTTLATLGACGTNTWHGVGQGGGNSSTDVDLYQNNIFCGSQRITQFTIEVPSNTHAIQQEQFDYKNTTSCPAGSNLTASNINSAFTSANNQSFPSGGNGTWSNSVISNLSIRQVQYFIDGSTTAAVTQQIQDVNTNFATDRKWLYHATINISGLSIGSHTIAAVATDVSGATQSVSQSFTTGATPVPVINSFTANPASINIGSSSTLSFSVTGATSMLLNPGNINVSGLTSFVVTPLSTTQYSLVATNTAGSSPPSTVTVTVRVAQSYFVSSSTGVDTNPGTQAAPWKTISKASAGPAGGYIPGDSVHLKAGDTWCQTGGTCAFPATFTANFTTPSSGTSGNPITYGTYGAGAAPVLDGSGGFGVVISRNFITWNGIQVKNIAGTGILFSNTTGTQIRNVTATNVNNWAFKGYQVGTSTLDGNTCTSTSGFVQLSGCIIAQVNGATPQTQTITATHNTCHFDFLNTTSSGGNVICVEVGGPVATNSSIVGNLSFGGTQFGGFKPGSCTGAGTADVCFGQVTGGLIADNEIHKAIFFGTPGSTTLVGDGETIELQGAATAIQTGVIVTRNVIYGQQSVGGVTGGTNVAGNTNDLIGLFQAQGNSIYGNVLVCPCGNEYAIQFETNAGGNSVFNNTIIQAPLNLAISNIPTQMAIRIGTDSNETIKNNIISGFAQGITGNNSNISDYNLFTSTVTSPVVGGVAAGTNSLIGPTPASVFATTPAVLQNDVKLIAGSLAASAGLNLGVAFSQILDPSGAVVPYSIFTQTTSWEMGAFGTTLLAPARTVINGAVISGAVIQ